MTGTIVHGDRAGYFSVGEVLGSGKDATVYAIHGDDAAAFKAWAKAAVPHEAAFIVETLSTMTKRLEGVAAVLELVRTRAGGDIIGIRIERVKGPTLKDAKFRNADHRIDCAVDYARTMEKLVERSGFHYDQHPGNLILCEKTDRLKLIDCDGMCIGELKWPDGTTKERIVKNGTLEWSPPELCGEEAVVKCCPHAAGYVTAMTIWRVLMDEHPGLCVDADGEDLPLNHRERLVKRMWAQFVSLPEGIKPANRGIGYEALPDRLKWLFELTLAPRGVGTKQVRGSVRDFRKALEEWRDSRRAANRRERFVVTAVAGAVLGTVAGLLTFGVPLPAPVNPPAVEQKAPAQKPQPKNARPLLLEE